ncbi:hypothetical protein A3B35_03030 [Candidatus Kaiserbacteria bacterium RIFCSPLOWO2_01_FULL_54_24]|uniref:Uncharacterized protein n=1 Tax=Candidatus Kaiserbacteria bacterium RIFCSPLOWO2_01_FULL_54_24 TaxID=1798515 RepID=A0A1F6ET14_9BACT|nr:MAG: hypothetical protein A3B35_03030 [Candidatus Kaiserbacteria bacterium RIFCSPLOWO2_01_FULL_54_24]
MDSSEKYLRFARAAALGSIAASVVVAVVTIGGEEWAPLKDTLKNALTHHWLGKSVVSAAVFGVVFLLTAWQPSDVQRTVRALWYAIGAAALSAAAMTFYFVLHTLGLV